ncbi:hypothetical protein ACHQM5_012304 [Ranunculus cassubicifolius]
MAISSSSPISHQIGLVVAILVFFLGFTLYINYESILESIVDQLKVVLTLSPLVLIFMVFLLSKNDGRQSLFPVGLPEKEAFHRAGGSPWGVGALVVVLLVMISYQSSFHEYWFPTLSKS